jgi:type II secretory pathway pseudopilin PulG
MNRQRGFTVLEFGISIIIVFVLIAVIAFFLMQASNRAADASIRQLSTQFQGLAEIYYLDHDKYGGHSSVNTWLMNSSAVAGQSEVITMFILVHLGKHML